MAPPCNHESEQQYYTKDHKREKKIFEIFMTYFSCHTQPKDSLPLELIHKKTEVLMLQTSYK